MYVNNTLSSFRNSELQLHTVRASYVHTNSVCLAESLLVSHCSRGALKAKHVSKHLLQLQETEEKEKQMHEGRGILWLSFSWQILL